MNLNYDKFDTLALGQQTLDSGLEFLDIITIYSLMLQIEDHRMATHNRREIDEIRDCLRQINAKLNKIIELLTKEE